MGTDDILKKTSDYVTRLLDERLPPWAVYHNLVHTQETVEAASELCDGMKLVKADREVVMLAAWLHDAGYVDAVENHEEASAGRAQVFLREMSYPDERIAQVVGCILATKIPQQPSTVPEQIVCDADLLHIGQKKFLERSNLLRLETERRTGTLFTDEEWLNINVDFVARHAFHTPYAKAEYSRRRTKNLIALQEQLRGQSEKGKQRDAKQEVKKERERIPERGIETMFRTVPQNHLSLSSMADNKANLMISTNSIIISIVFGLLVSKLDTNPHLIIPTMILLAVCLTAMIFAILVTRPNVTTGRFSREDIEQKRANLLFFGNFHSMPLQDFEWGMNEMMRDREYLYGSMIRDLFFLGKVLGKKYRYLRICYTIFMYGLIVAVVAFVLAFMYAPAPLT